MPEKDDVVGVGLGYKERDDGTVLIEDMNTGHRLILSKEELYKVYKDVIPEEQYRVLTLFSSDTDVIRETYVFPLRDCELREKESQNHVKIGEAYTEARKKENYNINDFEEELEELGIEYVKPFHVSSWKW